MYLQIAFKAIKTKVDDHIEETNFTESIVRSESEPCIHLFSISNEALG